MYNITENTLSLRGKLINSSVINLPKEWEKIVDPYSITVSITPVGSHQNIIIKRLDVNGVHLQSNIPTPIECFYHVFAEKLNNQ
jgi:hypothetical protein